MSLEDPPEDLRNVEEPTAYGSARMLATFERVTVLVERQPVDTMIAVPVGAVRATAAELDRLRRIERAAREVALNAEWQDDGESATVPASLIRALVTGS